jgi:hypothetical protein
LESKIEKNKLLFYISSIAKGLLVAVITYLGIVIGGALLGNLVLPEVLSDWSIENPISYVFVFIPAIIIISIILSQHSKLFSKNIITQFLYYCEVRSDNTCKDR